MSTRGRIALLNLISCLGGLSNPRRAELLVYIAQTRDAVPCGFRFGTSTGSPSSKAVYSGLMFLESEGLLDSDRSAGGLNYWLTAAGTRAAAAPTADGATQSAVRAIQSVCAELSGASLARLEEIARGLLAAKQRRGRRRVALKGMLAESTHTSGEQTWSPAALAGVPTTLDAALLDSLADDMKALRARFREISPSTNQITAASAAEYAYIALARADGVRALSPERKVKLVVLLQDLRKGLRATLKRSESGEPLDSQAFDAIDSKFDVLQSYCAEWGVLPSLREWPIDYARFSVHGELRGLRN